MDSVRRKMPRRECEWVAKSYCECWPKLQRTPVLWMQPNTCTCGEDNNASEWNWEQPHNAAPRSVVLSDDGRQVFFHPYYSERAVVVKGDTPFLHDQHYYWEVKILTETYGTDITVGLGSPKVNLENLNYEFTSLLGRDAESYGLSYHGRVLHDAKVAQEGFGFCRGTIVGVRVDMWHGTLEFYLNRKPLGISFFNLRRHKALFPMLCSSAAQSSMRLIYTSSWKASLLVDAAKILASSLRHDENLKLPPGLWYMMKKKFWMILPTEARSDEDDWKGDSLDREEINIPARIIAEVLPSNYMNGFYVDSVEREYRLVLWQ